MKSHTSIACGILAGTVLTGIGIILTGWPAEADSPIEVKELAVANNKFAFELYARLANEPGNLVLSPFSTGAAFAMTSAGARGETARQMAKTLHFSSWPSDVHTRFASLLKELNDTNASRCRLVIANSLWRQKGFPVNHLFHEIVRDQYGGYLGEVDFRTFADAARQQINGWVATQTQGKIKDMIESGLVHSETDLVLGNAVYFEGRWSIPFDKDSTKLTPFHLSSGKSVPIPMMNALHTFRYVETTNLQALEMVYGDAANWEDIPYVSNRFSMVILLPKKMEGLSQLEQTLTPAQIDKLRNQSRLEEVILSLPRFKIGSGILLESTLQAMGMSDAFTKERADFSGITEVKPLFIDFVLHRARVDVDEEGTVAAASTMIGATHGGFPMNVPVFNANHPFLFLICHNPTGVILFLGRVINPLK